MAVPPITQSLIKQLQDYVQGNECGLRFEYSFIEGNYFPPTEAMMLGIYFEYVAFGTLPKDGKVPKPVFKKGKKGVSPETDLLKKYAIMFQQAENLISYLKEYGLKKISAGEKISVVLENGIVVEGTTDLKLEALKDIPIINPSTNVLAKTIPAGTMIIADTKTSGLLGDRGKWAELGWHIDFLDEKPKIMIQAVHYVFIEWKKTGVISPFMFFVHSQSNDKDVLFVEVEVSIDRLLAHEEIIIGADMLLRHHIKKGFKAIPDFDRCNDCGLNESCRFKEVKPKIYAVNY